MADSRTERQGSPAGDGRGGDSSAGATGGLAGGSSVGSGAGSAGGSTESARDAAAAAAAPGRMEVALLGALPCVVCGYDLQGMSIRGACPECGTLVRATILYRVDPQAEEFAPLYSAKLVGAGLVLWIGGGLVVAMAGWARRGGEALDRWALTHDPRSWLGTVALGGLVVSLLGAVSIVRPSRTTRWWKSMAAVFGVLAYWPLLWSIDRLSRLDAATPPVLFGSGTTPEREVARLVMSLSLIAVCLGLRFVARDMAKRSLALRTRRVDRQTLLAIALAAAVGGIGDAMRLWAAVFQPELGSSAVLTLNAMGGAVVVLASLFLTLGLMGSLVDSLRIARTLWRPGPTMRQLIGVARPAGR